MRGESQSSFEELSKLIITAIESEQFFNKQTLIPKVKAILQGFKMDINASNYNKIDTPSETAKKIRMLEELDKTVSFWRLELKNIVKDMSPYYNKLDTLRESWGFSPIKNNQ